MKAVVIVSGGLDSTTLLYDVASKYDEVYALTFVYGQRHSKEIEYAKYNCEKVGVKEHKIIDISFLKELTKGASALTDTSIDLPENREIDDSIPISYVPFRNTVMLAIALSYAESIGATDVFYGANAIDYSGYPDCRPEYVEAFNKLTDIASARVKIQIHAPYVTMRKHEIIQRGLELGVDYSKTWSCYKGGDKACGVCDSCRLRLDAFRKLGIEDPIEYERR